MKAGPETQEETIIQMQPMEMTTAATTISPAIAVTTPLMVALAMTLSEAIMDTTLLMAEMEMTS